MNFANLYGFGPILLNRFISFGLGSWQPNKTEFVLRYQVRLYLIDPSEFTAFKRRITCFITLLLYDNYMPHFVI